MKINTVLLITLDQSGQALAQIQSGVVPFPRVIQVSSPQALEEAWEDQKNNEIFYDSIYSIHINQELSEKMKELGIKDGVYTKADDNSIISAAVKKYCLGNRSEEYELREDYLNWLPENYEDWKCPRLKSIEKTELTISDGVTKKTLFLHRLITTTAFPMSFWREKESEKWSNFAIVSEVETSEKFIIPLY